MMDESRSPLAAIYGASGPWQVPEFPLVEPSADHVVLYKVGEDDGDGLLSPHPGRDAWDKHHVKMPCSDGYQNVYEVTNYYVMPASTNRWKVIEKALTPKKPITNSHELAKAILKYNGKFEYEWKFRGLHCFFNDYLEKSESRQFFKDVLPSIIKLALDLPNLIHAPIPLLKAEMNKSISMSQQQIASLLANAFLCTFPRRNAKHAPAEFETYPKINFSALYERVDYVVIMEKLRCIIHYFKRVCRNMPTGVVTFSRRSVHPQQCPQWSKCETPIKSIPLHVDDDTGIENADGLIQVNFANQFLGGAILGGGCVQEEIRFLICPEMMASMLFTEKLEPNEAVMVIGCERYCKYTGYGHRNFRFAGDYVDTTPLDGSGRRRCVMLAIDAVYFFNADDQYQKHMVTRELNKAWIGFSFHTDSGSENLEYPGVATGNWGCGAFNGSPQLKSLLQLMACAQARRPMAYYTFHDFNFKEELLKIYRFLKEHDVTVGYLYKLITKYCKTDRKLQLHTFIELALQNDIEEAAAEASSQDENSSGRRRKDRIVDSSESSSESDDDRRKGNAKWSYSGAVTGRKSQFQNSPQNKSTRITANYNNQYQGKSQKINASRYTSLDKYSSWTSNKYQTNNSPMKNKPDYTPHTKTYSERSRNAPIEESSESSETDDDETAQKDKNRNLPGFGDISVSEYYRPQVDSKMFVDVSTTQVDSEMLVDVSTKSSTQLNENTPEEANSVISPQPQTNTANSPNSLFEFGDDAMQKDNEESAFNYGGASTESSSGAVQSKSKVNKTEEKESHKSRQTNTGNVNEHASSTSTQNLENNNENASKSSTSSRNRGNKPSSNTSSPEPMETSPVPTKDVLQDPNLSSGRKSDVSFDGIPGNTSKSEDNDIITENEARINITHDNANNVLIVTDGISPSGLTHGNACSNLIDGNASNDPTDGNTSCNINDSKIRNVAIDSITSSNFNANDLTVGNTNKDLTDNLISFDVTGVNTSDNINDSKDSNVLTDGNISSKIDSNTSSNFDCNDLTVGDTNIDLTGNLIRFILPDNRNISNDLAGGEASNNPIDGNTCNDKHGLNCAPNYQALLEDALEMFKNEEI